MGKNRTTISVIVFTNKCIIHWNETEMQIFLHCLKFIQKIRTVLMTVEPDSDTCVTLLFYFGLDDLIPHVI